MRLSKKALACGLALTLVATATGPSDVALAAKKPSISKKSISVTVGKTKKVTVKNAKKTVKWSSSKKKVATVKASGKKKATATIKGISKGTSVITAKVGSKKLTCKVKVNAPATQIKSMDVDVLDTSCIVLTMKKQTTINVSDLVVATKNYKEGSYNYKPSIKTIASSDQITYRLYLDYNISEGDWIKLTFNKKDVIEKQYKQSIKAYDNTQYLEKDSVCKIEADRNFSHCIGKVSYSVEGTLPAGMVLNTKRGIIKGIPTTVGTSTFKLIATDELGRKASANLTYNVYDETVVMAENLNFTVRLDDYTDQRVSDTASNIAGQTYYKRVLISPYGGSGKYKYSLASPDIKTVRLSTDVTAADGTIQHEAASEAYLYIPFELTEGAHSYSITIQDAVDNTKQTTITVTATGEKYVNVAGIAQDVGLSNLTGNLLYFYPVGSTNANSYVSQRTFVKNEDGYEVNDDIAYTAKIGSDPDQTKEMGIRVGTYKTELKPGQYIVKIQSDADDIRYQMTDPITITADGLYEVKAPIKFYSVSGVAKYLNGDPIANDKIYFEMKEQQYEKADNSNFKFNVSTDANGMFTASLPRNKYVAYMYSEGTNRQYFTTDVEVTDNNVTLNDFKINITRYAVSGVASNGTDPLKKQTLRFYDSTGYYKTVETDDSGAFKIGLAGNTTYTVKARINGNWHVIGTIPVTTQAVNQSLSYSFANEVQSLTQSVTVNTPLRNDAANGTVMAKYTCATSGSHTITVSVDGDARNQMSIALYNEDGSLVDDDLSVGGEYGSVSKISTSARLEAGKNYYVIFTAENYNANKDQFGLASGAYILNIADPTGNSTVSGK